MRYLIMLVAILGWTFVTTATAQACSCGGPGTPCDSYGSAAAVFAGTVTATRENEPPNPADRDELFFRRVFKFSVEQSFLGVSGTEVEVGTGSGGGDCGFDFKVGGRYLVYAYRYQNQLITTICSRTKPFANATEDLAFLGTLSSATPGATIHGQIVRSRDAKTELAAMTSAALITIEGGNVRREARPDAEGRYRVSGLSPGRYKVRLQLPETLITDRPEQEVIVADRGCAPASYYVADNGRLSGRAVDAEGQPVKGLRIALVDPDADPNDSYARGDRTDSDGRFNVSSVPAGRYLMTVNVSRFRDPTDASLAYPPVYYPGVADRANAELITVGPGEKLTDLDIRVPLRKPPSRATIVVVWADGSPVSNALLTLSDPTGEPGIGYGAQADEHGRLVINGFVGQQVSVEARSNRQYVQVGPKFEPMERSEKVRVTLKKPNEKIRVVITKLR